jgi:hypothetical protein
MKAKYLANSRRAERARQVLAAYNDKYDIPGNIVDILADLQHYCHIAREIDRRSFDDALRIARMHFEAEIDGEGLPLDEGHTPGTWQRNGSQVIAVHTDEDGEHETLICDVYNEHDWWRANARLIVAAPRLLAAASSAKCQLADYCSGDDGRDTDAHQALRELREAIAEATGGRV